MLETEKDRDKERETAREGEDCDLYKSLAGRAMTGETQVSRQPIDRCRTAGRQGVYQIQG